MPIELPSVPNPGFEETFTTSARRGGKPILFQITDPLGQPLYPYLLAMHVNPSDFNEGFVKSKNVVMTYGGFVEFNWPDELDTISINSSTGAFLGPEAGLTSGSDNTNGSQGQPSFAAGGKGRHATMAWERQEDLLELFRCNGVIYNGSGQPVLRGRVMIIYDRGIYMGHFKSFQVTETDEKAFTFELAVEFAFEETVYVFPGSTSQLTSRIESRASGVTQTPEQIEADLIAGAGVFSNDQTSVG